MSPASLGLDAAGELARRARLDQRAAGPAKRHRQADARRDLEVGRVQLLAVDRAGGDLVVDPLSAGRRQRGEVGADVLVGRLVEAGGEGDRSAPPV